MQVSSLEDTRLLDVMSFLPHRPPFILISEFLGVEAEKAHSRVLISERSAFCDNGMVPNYVGLEYIAQTIALYSGAHSPADEPEAIGFLLSVRDCQFRRQGFAVGEELKIEVTLELLDSGLATFWGEIKLHGECICSARVTTYKPTPEELEKIKEEAWNVS